MNPHTPPRPTSSPTSSQTRDDLPEATSSRRPYPERDDVALRPSTPPPPHTPPPRPRDDVITATLIDHIPATLACDHTWDYDVDFTAACALATDHPGPHTTTIDGNDQVPAHTAWPWPARMEVTP